MHIFASWPYLSGWGVHIFANGSNARLCRNSCPDMRRPASTSKSPQSERSQADGLFKPAAARRREGEMGHIRIRLYSEVYSEYYVAYIDLSLDL